MPTLGDSFSASVPNIISGGRKLRGAGLPGIFADYSGIFKIILDEPVRAQRLRYAGLGARACRVLELSNFENPARSEFNLNSTAELKCQISGLLD